MATTDVVTVTSTIGLEEMAMKDILLDMKATDAVNTEAHAMMIILYLAQVGEPLVKTGQHVVAIDVDEAKVEMEWELQREGPRLRKVLRLCLSGSARLQVGTFMHLVTSSTQLSRPNKPVWPSKSPSIIADRRIQGLFNLPGANRTQIPPILGIAGLPPPMPVQTFGMGIGSNPNLSRQSRRLYIGSITPEVNEQNLADFFNSKMIEMSIGTGGPGNPVLAVQCNYEKNYAFIEVWSFSIESY